MSESARTVREEFSRELDCPLFKKRYPASVCRALHRETTDAEKRGYLCDAELK